MDNIDLKKQAAEETFNRINELKEDVGVDSAFKKSPVKYDDNKRAEAREAVAQASKDNDIIGIALANAREYHLDAAQIARLKSIMGRNTTNMLLNNHRYKKDSKLMKTVKEKLTAVEDALKKPFNGKVNVSRDTAARKNRAKEILNIEVIYQNAVAACKDYLLTKSPGSTKGEERYLLVNDRMRQMIEEYTYISRARQLLFRGKIGVKSENLKELLVEEREYSDAHKTLNEEEKEQAEQSAKYSDEVTTVYEDEINSNFNSDMKFFHDAILQESLPNALVDKYGTDEKEKARAINVLKEMQKVLSTFPPDCFMSASFVVGKNIINVFQREDNQLEVIFHYEDKNLKDIRHRMLTVSTNARVLSNSMGINMIEHEEVFGKKNTARILSKLEDPGENNDQTKKITDSDLASALLRKRLKIKNIELSNIPHEERIKLVKNLLNKSITREKAIEKIKRYEYGNISAKKQENEHLISLKNAEKEELNRKAGELGYKNVKELVKEHKRKKQEKKLTEEENKKLQQTQAQAQQQAQAQVQEQQQAQAQVQEQQQAQVQEQQQVQAQENQQAQVQVWEQQLEEGLPEEVVAFWNGLVQKRNSIREQEQVRKQDVTDSTLAKKTVLTEQKNLCNDLLQKISRNKDEKKAGIEKDIKKAIDKDAGIDNKKLNKIEQKYNDEINKYQLELQKLYGDKLTEVMGEDSGLKLNDNEQNKEQYDQKREELREGLNRILRDIDNDINSTDSKLQEDLQRIDRETSLQLDEVNADFALFNSWKNHYVNNNAALNSIQEGFEVVEQNGEELNVHSLRAKKPKDFEAFKQELAADHKRREDELKEAERKKELKKQLIDSYLDINEDIKEIKRRGISSMTDERVNAEDTLDLLRHRNAKDKDGTLKECVVFAADMAEAKKKKKETDEITERDRLKELINIYKEKIDSTDKRKTLLEKTLEDQKRLLEEAEEDYKAKQAVLQQNNADELRKIEKKINALKKAINKNESELKNKELVIDNFTVQTSNTEKLLKEQEILIRKTEKANIQARKNADEEIKKKNEAVENGKEWSDDELILKNIMAELVYAQDTWEMDEVKKPGMRLRNVLGKYAGPISILIANTEYSKNLISSFVKKLPLGILGLKEKELTDVLNNFIESANEMAVAERDKLYEQIDIRDRAREERKAAKTAEIEQRKKDRADRAAAEKDQKKAKLKEEYEKFLAKEKDFVPSAELNKFIEYKQQKEQERQNSWMNSLKSFLGYEVPKEEESAEELEKSFDDVAQTELEAQYAREDELWEKEIENAGKDKYYKKDQEIKSANEYFALMEGIRLKLAEKPDPEEPNPEELDDEFTKSLGDIEANMETLVHKQLRNMQKSLKKVIDKEFNENIKEIPIKKVKYYREKGISAEEKKLREEQGVEQLHNMIINEVAGKDGQAQFLKNILSSYVGQSSVLDQRSMIASAIRNCKPAALGENATDKEKRKAANSYLGGVFKGAGPLLQKILQGIPDGMIPQGMEESFEDLKSNLSPIPRNIVEAELLSIVERSEGSIKKIEVIESLGAASVGQAFLCNVYLKGKRYPTETVIKLLRPDVRNRMLREEKILKKCAKDTGDGMLKTFEGQMIRYKEELDLTIEAKNAERGAIYDEKNVSSMKVSRLAAPTPNALMLEKAKGDTVVGTLKKSKAKREKLFGDFYVRDEKGNIVMEGDKPKLAIPTGVNVESVKDELSVHLFVMQKQQRMLCEMAEKWVNEAMFGKGFYHGDLHAGNIMLDTNHLTVIDFGNATQLNEFEQEKITQMLMAACAGNGAGFMEGYEALLGEGSKKLLEKKRDELQKSFDEIMKLGNFSATAERIAAALISAQKMGFELPNSIYGFQQCQLRIQNTIDDFNKEIVELQKVMTQLNDLRENNIFNLSDIFKETTDVRTCDTVMRMGLIPTEGDDFLKFIRDTSDNKRKVMDDVLNPIFEPASMYYEWDKNYYSDEELASHIFIAQGQEKVIYDNQICGLISRKEWKEIVADGGFELDKPLIQINAINDDKLKDKFMSQFEKGSDEEKARGEKLWAEKYGEIMEKRIKIAQQIKEKLKEVDVRGALDELREAQDLKKPREEQERLEQVVVERFKLLKTRYLTQKKESIPEEISAIKITHENEWLSTNTQAERDNPVNKARHDEEIRQDQEEIDKNMAIYDKAFNFDKFVNNIKDKLSKRDDQNRPVNLDKAEEQLKPLFKDADYGAKIEAAFNAYKTAAQADADNADQLLNELLNSMRIPLLISLGIKGSAIEEMPYSMNAPDAFLQVMGGVLGDKWKTAIKRLNPFKALKYAWRIAEDSENRSLSIKDAWNIVVG
ncbi:MAG: phosphotransferase [Lachnospiraceae bacterium]|nr:phosphotransferase [Lachnospiraceae bacterium]